MRKTNYFLFLFFVIFITNIAKSDDPEIFTGEVGFTNRTTHEIYIKIYPISMIHNGYKQYSLKSRSAYNNALSNIRYDYNGGVFLQRTLPDTTFSKKIYLTLGNGATKYYQFDLDVEENNGSLGFGKYKIIFSNDNEFIYNIIDTITLEYDNKQGASLNPDVYFFYNNNGRISFYWGASSERYIDSSTVNRKIECWNQYENGVRAKDFGNFSYDTTHRNFYDTFPQDSRKDCNLEYREQNQEFSDSRSGVLTLNLTIDKKISTRDTLIDNPTNIVVTSNAFLKINSADTLEMITPTYPSNGSNQLIFDSLSILSLSSNAKLIIHAHNKLTLRKNSGVKFFPGSGIIIYPGGFFCNEGAEILGQGKIIYKSGSHQPMCNQLSDYWIRDSAKIILDTNAVLEIPDSTTLHFTGNTTSLTLNANSKLKFGVGSKILIDSGAKIIANNAQFCSTDSTKKWLGITIKGLSQDTIKNCTVKNAFYGINITSKYDSDTTKVYSTEISGCDFVNETSSALNNAVYVYNSNNILIKDNNVSSTIGQVIFSL